MSHHFGFHAILFGVNLNLFSVQEMEYKKVLVIKDIHNNTDQESQQAQSAKRKKLLNKTKIKLEPINKPTQ